MRHDRENTCRKTAAALIDQVGHPSDRTTTQGQGLGLGVHQQTEKADGVADPASALWPLASA